MKRSDQMLTLKGVPAMGDIEYGRMHYRLGVVGDSDASFAGVFEEPSDEAKTLLASEPGVNTIIRMNLSLVLFSDFHCQMTERNAYPLSFYS